MKIENMLKAKEKINIIMITENKGIEFLKIDASKNSFEYRNRKYLVDEKTILIKKNKRYLVYYQEKPKPLLIDEAKKSLELQGLGSFELNKLFKPHLLDSLIPQISILNLVTLLLVIASCVICIYLVVSFGAIQKSQAKVYEQSNLTRESMVGLVSYIQTQFLPYVANLNENQGCCLLSSCPFISFGNSPIIQQQQPQPIPKLQMPVIQQQQQSIQQY